MPFISYTYKYTKILYRSFLRQLHIYQHKHASQVTKQTITLTKRCGPLFTDDHCWFYMAEDSVCESRQNEQTKRIDKVAKLLTHRLWDVFGPRTRMKFKAVDDQVTTKSESETTLLMTDSSAAPARHIYSAISEQIVTSNGQWWHRFVYVILPFALWRLPWSASQCTWCRSDPRSSPPRSSPLRVWRRSPGRHLWPIPLARYTSTVHQAW